MATEGGGATLTSESRRGADPHPELTVEKRRTVVLLSVPLLLLAGVYALSNSPLTTAQPASHRPPSLLFKNSTFLSDAQLAEWRERERERNAKPRKHRRRRRHVAPPPPEPFPPHPPHFPGYLQYPPSPPPPPWPPLCPPAPPAAPPGSFPVTRDDLLVVIPTATHRHDLVYASGDTWRGQLKTFVASNGTQQQGVERHTLTRQIRYASSFKSVWFDVQPPLLPGAEAPPQPRYPLEKLRGLVEQRRSQFRREVWEVYPDEFPNRGQTPGDKRMLASVRLAKQAFPHPQDWKWMLWGDDDCWFFVDNVLTFLRDLDPAQPYYMSDDIGSCCQHFEWCRENVTAGCQLPSPEGHIWGYSRKLENGTVPCIQQPAMVPCDHHAYKHPNLCPEARWRMRRILWANGGRGLIISRGLVDLMGAEAMYACEEGPVAGAGDGRLARCIHHITGITITNPTRNLHRCRFGRVGGIQLPFEGMIKEYKRAEELGYCDTHCEYILYSALTATIGVHHTGAAQPRLELMASLNEHYNLVRSMDRFVKHNRLLEALDFWGFMLVGIFLPLAGLVFCMFCGSSSHEEHQLESAVEGDADDDEYLETHRI